VSKFDNNLHGLAVISQTISMPCTSASVASQDAIPITSIAKQTDMDLPYHEIIRLGFKNNFPPRKFIIDTKPVYKTPILNMFVCPSTFDVVPIEKVNFKCKGCGKEIISDFRKVFI
jgi:hypothetical protein